MSENVGTPFAVITAVWGREYAEFYAAHVLPTSLPSGCAVIAATTMADADMVRSLVGGKAKVIVADMESSDKYRLASSLEKFAIRWASAHLGFKRFVLQNPDLHISSAAFERCVHSSHRIITVPGIRIHKEEYLAAYGSIRAFADDDLLLNAMTCLHPSTKALAISGGYRAASGCWPSTLYAIEPRRIFGVAFHRHPLMFEVGDLMGEDTGTLDDRFLSSLGHGLSADYEFPGHSSEGYILEFSSLSHSPHKVDRDRIRLADVKQFARSCSREHREFARHTFTWSSDPDDVYQNPFDLMEFGPSQP